MSIVDDIISGYSNSIEILKDKLKSNSYLVFKDFNISSSGSSLYENVIFRIIKLVHINSKDNIQFYEKIFQLWFNLSNGISGGSSGYIGSTSNGKGRNINSDIDILFTFAVKQSNYVAAKVLVNNFMNRSNELTRSIIEYSGLVTIHQFQSYCDFKLFNYLNNKYSLSNGTSSNDPASYQFNQFKVFESIKLKQLLKLVNTTSRSKLKQFNFTNEQLNSTVKYQLELPTQQTLAVNYSSSSSTSLTLSAINSIWDHLFKFSYNSNNNSYNHQFINRINSLVANIQIHYHHQQPRLNIEIIKRLLDQQDNTNQSYYTLSKYVMVLLIDGKEDSIGFIEGLIQSYQFKMNRVFQGFIEFTELLPVLGSTSTLDLYYNYYKSIAFNNNENWKLVTSHTVLEHYEKIMIQLGYSFNINCGFNRVSNYHHDNHHQVPILETIIKALNNSKVYKIISTSNVNNGVGFYIEALEDTIYHYFNTGRKVIVFQLFKEFFGRSTSNSFHIEDRNLNDSTNQFITWIINNYSNIIKTEHLVELVVDLDKFDYQGDTIQDYQYYEYQNYDQDIESKSISFKLSEDYLFKILYSRNKYNDIFKALKIFNIFESYNNHHHHSNNNNNSSGIIRNGFIQQLIQFILNQQQHQQKNQSKNKPLDYSKRLLKSILIYSASFGNLELFKYIESSKHCNQILSTKDSKCIFNNQELKSILISAYQGSNHHQNHLDIIKLLSSLSNINISDHEIYQIKRDRSLFNSNY